MNLLQQLHIWKLRSCAVRHEKKARSLKKRLLAEIRQLNHEIRKEEKSQRICTKLANLRAFKLEQRKVTGRQSNGLQRPYTEEEMAYINQTSFVQTGGWGEL